MKEISCFISPHGFGHATRTIAVLEALQCICPDIHIQIFTTVPEALFAQTITGYSYHSVKTDVGLVQSSALETDFPATISQLNHFLPSPPTLLDELTILCANSSMVLCDISPLGIMVAQQATIPSVLIENFTWDWIYQSYLEKQPGFKKHVRRMNKLFTQADFRIQTEPLCHPAPRDLFCGPIFRRSKGVKQQIREQLGCADKKVVLITMGGFAQRLPDIQRLKQLTDLFFLFCGQKTTERLAKNIVLLGKNSSLYHPDLLCIADLVVCKAGYSTVAECCQAGARVISVGRADFPESQPLQNYLKERLGAVSISAAQYETGWWLSMIPELLSLPKPPPERENGADRVAGFLFNLLQEKSLGKEL